jgi:arachidonate 5-lipoxygenase
MSDRYDVTIKTGTRSGAGTNANISITFVGTDGTAGPFKLDKWLHNDFEKGKTDTYKVKSKDVGDILAIRFHSDGGSLGIGGDWMFGHAVITRDDRDWYFPNFSWLRPGHSITVLEGEARLPSQSTIDGAADMRRAQIQAGRERFPWRDNPDGALPGSLEISEDQPIPIDERYRDLAEGAYSVVFAKTMASMKLTSNVMKKVWDSIDDVYELFATFTVPSVAERWQTDEEFARQAVQGVSPVHIEICKELPDGFELSEEEVYGLLQPGMTLSDAMEQNRLFKLDFSELVGIKMYEKEGEDGVVEHRFAPAARALFFEMESGQQRPLAIQPTPGGLVFTSKDDKYDWMAAKMYLRCAEGNVHQMLAHAINTHFTMEPFVMATLRNLAACHPVYKLLKRHFRYTLAINEGARQSLLSEGAVFDTFMATGGPDKGHLQLAVEGYGRWKLMDNALPYDLEKRGVADPAVLGYYPYRDDGMLIWNALGEYVSETLAIFYADDAALQSDNEMQDWWTDLITNGHTVDRLPCDDLSKVSDLAMICQTVIWTVSCLHSAVNYQQYEHYAFLPNAPLCMRKAPPEAKGTLNEQAICEMMPSKTQGIWQVAIGRALASYGNDEEYLLDEIVGWHEDFFEEPAAKAVIRRFHERMVQAQAVIDKANAERPVPYLQLQPKMVPSSITI